MVEAFALLLAVFFYAICSFRREICNTIFNVTSHLVKSLSVRAGCQLPKINFCCLSPDDAFLVACTFYMLQDVCYVMMEMHQMKFFKHSLLFLCKQFPSCFVDFSNQTCFVVMLCYETLQVLEVLLRHFAWVVNESDASSHRSCEPCGLLAFASLETQPWHRIQ